MVDPTISNFEQEYTDMKINIDIEQEEETVVSQDYPHTDINSKSRMRKTKSSQYLDTYERIQTDISKDSPKKKLMKKGPGKKNGKGKKVHPHLTSNNLHRINRDFQEQNLHTEDFTDVFR